MNAGKACLFCGRVLLPKRVKHGGKTDEHIIPQWLIDLLDIRGKQIAPALHNVQTGVLLGRRQHTVGRFLAGAVCATCNNGWMSSLEDQAKPILTRLIADQNELVNLTDPERVTIARWTVKTAAIMNRVGPGSDPKYSNTRPVPDEHLRSLHFGSMPDGVVVVGGGYKSDDPLEFMESWYWPSASVSLKEEDKDRSYKIGFAFRGLMLAVAYFPNPEYVYGVFEGMYVPLWTGTRGVRRLQLPLKNLPPVTPCPMIEGFLDNILALSRIWLEIVDTVSTTKLIQIPGTHSKQGS